MIGFISDVHFYLDLSKSLGFFQGTLIYYFNDDVDIPSIF